MADTNKEKLVEKLTNIADGFRTSRSLTETLSLDEMAVLAAVPIGSTENKTTKVIERTAIEIKPEDLEGLTSVGTYAFYKYPNLQSIELPMSTTTIDAYGFERAEVVEFKGLGLQQIYDYCFNNATNLTTVYLSKNLTRLANGVFEGASGVQNFYFDGTPGDWVGIIFVSTSSGPFNSNTVRNSKKAFFKNDNDEYEETTDLIIPEGTTAVRASACNYWNNLTSISIPSTVTSIGSQAFSYCSGITSLNLAEGLTSIGNGAFRNNTSLTNIVIPNTCSSIQQQAFYYNQALETVRIGNGILNIGNSCFGGCPNLTDIYIDKPEDSVSGAPWGASNATIHWNTPLPSN